MKNRRQIFSLAIGCFVLAYCVLAINTVQAVASCVNDDSDGVCLNIIKPSGGEALDVGEIFNIEWYQEGINAVSIGYKTCESCLEWIAFNQSVNSLQNNQNYEWEIPNDLDGEEEVWIEIIAAKIGEAQDIVYSNRFKINEVPKLVTEIIVSNPRHSNIGIDEVTILWDTNVDTAGTVFVYGRNKNAIYKEVIDSTYVKYHSIKVNGLEEDAAYRYVIRSTAHDGSQEYKESGQDYWPYFSTLKDASLGNQPLEVYADNFKVPAKPSIDIADDTVNFDWRVNENRLPYTFSYKDTGFYYSDSASCIRDLNCARIVRSLRTGSPGFSHWKVTLENLVPGTKYYFRMYADGITGSDIYDFTIESTIESDNSEGIVFNPTQNNNEVVANTNIQAEQRTIMIRNRSMYTRLRGRIMLKVEDSGKAYYVNPMRETVHYLGRPADAFQVMREQGVGITNANLEKIPLAVSSLSGVDSDGDGLSDAFEDAIGTNKNNRDTDGDGYYDKDEILSQYSPKERNKKYAYDNNFSNSQKGKIFLQVESKGEAWYINPEDGKRYFLGRPADAFNVMRNLGLGISNNDFDIL